MTKFQITQQVPSQYPAALIQAAQNHKQTNTGDLPKFMQKLNVKIDAKVVLTVNIGIQDRLINGQTGNIRYIELVQDSACKLYRMFSKKFIREIEVPIKKGSRSVCIKYTQFPLTLPWISLAHKVCS